MEKGKINFDKKITFDDVIEAFTIYSNILNEYEQAKKSLSYAKALSPSDENEAKKIVSVIEAKKKILETLFFSIEKSLLNSISPDKIPYEVLNRYSEFYTGNSFVNSGYSKEDIISIRREKIFDPFDLSMKGPVYLKGEVFEKAYEELGINFDTFIGYMALLTGGSWLETQIDDMPPKKEEPEKVIYPKGLKASFLPTSVSPEGLEKVDNSKNIPNFTDEEKLEMLNLASVLIKSSVKPINENYMGR